jgi:hypothetical protein
MEDVVFSEMMEEMRDVDNALYSLAVCAHVLVGADIRCGGNTDYNSNLPAFATATAAAASHLRHDISRYTSTSLTVGINSLSFHRHHQFPFPKLAAERQPVSEC